MMRSFSSFFFLKSICDVYILSFDKVIWDRSYQGEVLNVPAAF